MNELKWSDSRYKVRMAVIGEIAQESHLIEGVSACVIDKQWINSTLAHRQEVVRYNYAARLALEKGGLFLPATKGRKIHLTIDARNRRATETLNEYVELLAASNELPCSIELAAEDSENCPQLQVTDFVVGSVYAAYASQNWDDLNTQRKAGIHFSLRVLRRKTPAPLKPH